MNLEVVPLREILLNSNQELLWKSILGKFTIGKKLNITNPCRVDKHPGSVVMLDSKGILKLYDFSTRKAYTLVDYYLYLGKSIKQIEGILMNNMVSERRKINTSPKNDFWEFEITPIEWTKEHYIFWHEKGVLPELLSKYVTPFKNIYFRKGTVECVKFHPDIAFQFKGLKKKLYFPTLAKEKRYKAEYSRSLHLVEDNNSDTLFISKGWKDFLIIRSLRNDFDYVINNNEKFTEDNVKEVLRTTNKKYDKVIIFYDNDIAGLDSAQSAKKVCEMLVNPGASIETPITPFKYKDIDEFYEKIKNNASRV